MTLPAANADCCERSTPDTCIVSWLAFQTIAPVLPLPTVRPYNGLVWGELYTMSCFDRYDA